METSSRAGLRHARTVRPSPPAPGLPRRVRRPSTYIFLRKARDLCVQSCSAPYVPCRSPSAPAPCRFRARLCPLYLRQGRICRAEFVRHVQQFSSLRSGRPGWDRRHARAHLARARCGGGFMLLACSSGQLKHAPVGLAEPGILALRRYLADDGRVHGCNNVAEGLLTIERVIARSRLKPRRGSGWQPV